MGPPQQICACANEALSRFKSIRGCATTTNQTVICSSTLPRNEMCTYGMGAQPITYAYAGQTGRTGATSRKCVPLNVVSKNHVVHHEVRSIVVLNGTTARTCHTTCAHTRTHTHTHAPVDGAAEQKCVRAQSGPKNRPEAKKPKSCKPN